MNGAIGYLIPFIEAIQRQSHTIEITLDRPQRSQTAGTLDTFRTEGSRGVLRGSAGTLCYTGEPRAYLETITIWLSPEESSIELSPHESPLPIERFPLQNCVPLPYGLSITGPGFTATLSLSPNQGPTNSIPLVGQVRASR
jgi:hypothetical protein